MEALSGSQSLEGLIQSRKAEARWAGCSAKTFADAVVARLETLCETESYKADVLGKKARQYQRQHQPQQQAHSR